MRCRIIINHCVGIVLPVTLLASPVAARVPVDFDLPSKTVTIPSHTAPPSGYDATCLYYHDVMILIPDLDTPAPGNAMILPPSARCERKASSRGITLLSEHSALDGRKGPYLIFEWTDRQGAGNFTVFDVRNGKALFDDGLNYITSIHLSQDELQMRYNRGVNLPCSLYAEPDRCWSQLIAIGLVPRDVFSEPPSVQNCAEAYGKEPATYNSILSYDVGLTIESSGFVKMQPVGPLQCEPNLDQ